MSRESRESDSVMGDLQAALKKISLPYCDGLYDWQTDLAIQKNKDRENISSRSLRRITQNFHRERMGILKLGQDRKFWNKQTRTQLETETTRQAWQSADNARRDQI